MKPKPSLFPMTFFAQGEHRRLRRLRAGERAALDELVCEYERPLYNLALRLLGRVEDAEDATQEAFLTIFRALPTFEGRSSLTTWMYKIMVNVCLQRRRKDRTVNELPMEDWQEQPSSEAGPERHILATEMREELRAALDTLPDVQQAVVVLHELHGLTYAEVAAVLDCPVGTVKSRLSTAFGRLRRVIEANDAAPGMGSEQS